ncbi:MAG: hypothetical protein H0Z32_08240 [Bacillaceae bacterium]|nr:hypothetical protein [Bacillaceae bacterium]
MENVSILIPFQTDHGEREKIFRWVSEFYQNTFPMADFCTGSCKGETFSFSKAINQAAEQSKGDILIITGADIIINPEVIRHSIKLLETHPWVVPFSKVKDLNQISTRRLLNTVPRWPLRVPLISRKREAIGGMNILRRSDFEKVGGYDERFIGWGGEDDAFACAMDTLCGHHLRLDEDIFHLWHPSLRASGNPNYQKNAELAAKYCEAYGNKDRMKQLIQESKLNRP